MLSHQHNWNTLIRRGLCCAVLGLCLTATGIGAAETPGFPAQDNLAQDGAVRPPVAPVNERSNVEGAASLTRHDSAWARFEPGAWRRDRIAVLSQDETGEVHSEMTYDITTTLIAVEDDHYVVEVISQVKNQTAVKPVSLPKQTEMRSFDDTAYDPTASVSVESVEQAEVGKTGEQAPAREYIRQTNTEIADVRVVSRYVTFPNHFPGSSLPETFSRLVSRTTQRKHTTGGATHTTTIEWNLTTCDFLVSSPKGVGWVDFAEQVQESDAGKVITTQRTSPLVPGGLVESLSKDLSPAGDIRQGRELHLIDFGLEPPADGADDGMPKNETPNSVAAGQDIAPRSDSHASPFTTEDVLMFAPVKFRRLTRWPRWAARRARLRADHAAVDSVHVESCECCATCHRCGRYRLRAGLFARRDRRRPPVCVECAATFNAHKDGQRAPHGQTH